MHKIVYSNEAEDDISDIIDHIAKESESNALAYLERYDERMALLQANPKMGTPCANKNIDKVCRVLTSESHIVIYEESNDEIFIIRIFHQSVNYPIKV
ncbi:MAG: type II toxin-antitoxin system RelE/ParE family toxin [Campylobacterota bacterium]|nr:type II toxin-antitoxin system RelE/ParE family toxin [Campylobacterota bacterium]